MLTKLSTLIAVVVPLGGLIAALLHGCSPLDFTLFAGMSAATGLGITVGYHRLFTHRSFETYPWIEFVFGVLGGMAVQGPLLVWVGTHRRHHRYSDEGGDPHSPHAPWGGVRGFLWAHVGWMFGDYDQFAAEYAKDLQQSRRARLIDSWFLAWVAFGLLIPAAIGGWSGFLWGGLARAFFVFHVTWSVNSICHLFGTQTFDSRDESRNVWWLAPFTFGESWHNNHHAFPSSAAHGLKWWQIDVSYWLIRALGCVGLAWNIKRPPAKLLAKWSHK